MIASLNCIITIPRKCLFLSLTISLSPSTFNLKCISAVAHTVYVGVLLPWQPPFISVYISFLHLIFLFYTYTNCFCCVKNSAWQDSNSVQNWRPALSHFRLLHTLSVNPVILWGQSLTRVTGGKVMEEELVREFSEFQIQLDTDSALLGRCKYIHVTCLSCGTVSVCLQCTIWPYSMS